MKNIIGGMPQDYGLNKPEEEKKEKPKLEAIPIFRNNDLYAEIFPEIKPAFEKGEDPIAKKLFEVLMEYKNKKVILDNTCIETLQNSELGDFPSEFGLKEVPNVNGWTDMKKISELLKQYYDIDSDLSSGTTIDSKISELLQSNFSSESVRGLLEIAKGKNNNIKEVYILSNNIADHTGDFLDFFKDEVSRLKEEDIGDFYRDKVVAILKEEAIKEFGFEPKVISTIDNISDQSIQVITDRHNNAIYSQNLAERFPKQISMLPLASELFNNERFLGGSMCGTKVADEIRKIFEKKIESN